MKKYNHKLGIINGSIGYIKYISFIDVEGIPKKKPCIPP
jgi:hypothetical protein